MEYIEFKEKLITALQECLQNGEKVVPQVVPKLNGSTRDGIAVIDKNGSVRADALIYPDELYERLYKQKGLDMRACVEHVKKVLEERKRDVNLDVTLQDICSWDKIKEKVFPMLIKTERNHDLLGELVNASFLDLSVIYYVKVEFGSELKETGVVKITHPLFSQYRICQEQLHEQAICNLAKDEYHVSNLNEIAVRLLKQISDEEDMEELIEQIASGNEMLGFTNKTRRNGAAGILDLNLLDALEPGKNYFVIPSSIHETFWVEDKEDELQQEELDTMVRQVNAENVSDEEILSDHVYYYDAVKQEIRMRK